MRRQRPAMPRYGWAMDSAITQVCTVTVRDSMRRVVSRGFYARDPFGGSMADLNGVVVRADELIGTLPGWSRRVGGALVCEELVERACRMPGQPLDGVADLGDIAVGAGSPVVLVKVDQRTDEPRRHPEAL